MMGKHEAAASRGLIGAGTASTTDNAILYENSDLRAYSMHLIHNMGGAQDCDVDVSLDGTNWKTTVPLKNLADATLSATISDNEIGVIDGKIYAMRVRNKGGTTSADCVVIHY